METPLPLMSDTELHNGNIQIQIPRNSVILAAGVPYSHSVARPFDVLKRVEKL